jgi:hypothetical protein
MTDDGRRPRLGDGERLKREFWSEGLRVVGVPTSANQGAHDRRRMASH